MSRKKLRILLLVFVIVAIIIATGGYVLYKRLFKPNVALQENTTYLYIPTGSDLASVTTLLKEKQIISNAKTFLWVAQRKNYEKILPGRYKIQQGMSNNDLVNLLRSGKQEPVNVTFNNVYTVEQLAGKVSAFIEADSLDFIHYFDTATFFDRYFISKENIITIFLPNTYEFYWNTSAEQFVQRMKKEHDKFWTQKRADKAAGIGFTPQEVYTLASIVYAETKKEDEAARIAGVYVNRINKNIPLQADPTLKFALGDFTIKRILNKDKEVNSPYNTYKYTGLPPGPICMPPTSYLDAVLNFEKHDYIFFCAREDFSGYHSFARTLAEHNQNARRYQNALDNAGILR